MTVEVSTESASNLVLACRQVVLPKYNIHWYTITEASQFFGL